MKKIALCESCAKQQGVTDPEDLLMMDQLMDDLSEESMEELSLSEEDLLSLPPDVTCPSCEFEMEDYHKVGRLGCPQCYTTFKDEIGHRLPAIHKGVAHRGRIPEGFAQVEQIRAQLSELDEDLKRAIAEEDYEKAALVRDRIQHLKEKEGKEPIQS